MTPSSLQFSSVMIPQVASKDKNKKAKQIHRMTATNVYTFKTTPLLLLLLN